MATAPTMPVISKAKGRLLMKHPFFATLLLRTEVTITDRVPLAATDGERMYFNPDFLAKLSIEDVMCVMCHEIGHDSLLHSLRLGARNAELWNIACDHAINLMLIDQGFTCPKGVQWCADAKYKGWSADKIYDDLRRNPPPKPSPSQGDGEGDGDEDDDGQSGGQPQPGKGKPGKGRPGNGQPRDWLHGDVLPSPAKTEAEQAAAEQKAKQRVASAANMARMAGKLSGDLERMVDEFLETKVPWTDVLRDFMLRVVKSRESWNHRNKRFSHIYLPRRFEKQMGPIVFIPDTSGSMWGDDMEKICSEMAHCASQTQPENITVLWTDTAVKGTQVFTPDEFEFSKLKPMGGGGTDMCVGLKAAEALEPQVVVLLTDGYTPWPTDVPFPLIVVCTTDIEAPVGVTIHI
jgi:predicted metal-dependent peptidase